MAFPREVRRRVFTRRQLRIAALTVFAIGVLVAILFPAQIAGASQIPLFTLYSTARMFAAFLLSLLFAISYGAAAAASRRAEEVLIPILDILQSVPILGFFPIVFLILVGPNLDNVAGAEVAVVFLIFTSMSWNMAFGVYEAIKSLPVDLVDATRVFGVRDWLRFRRLALPATIPKLVYNSMLSWTVGWFYLVASEVFTAGSSGAGQPIVRPGIGSLIYQAGRNGDVGTIGLGLAALIAVVIALDTFMWRPLSVWAERFKMDVATAGESTVVPATFVQFGWLPRFTGLRGFLSRKVAPLFRSYETWAERLGEFHSRHVRAFRAVRRIDIAMVAAILVLGAWMAVTALYGIFTGPLPPDVNQIPVDTLDSLARLAVAYGVALAWTIFAAAWIVRSKRASKYVTPVLEVVASVPATALLPVIIGFVIAVVPGVGAQSQLAAFIIALFAMQWYLLFNLIAGMRGIPGDLQEAAKVFGLKGWTYWKRILLPAVMPSLLTGSITAWGAGWNSLIVAEFLQFGRVTFQVPGIGFLIYRATWGQFVTGTSATTGNSSLLLLSVLALSATVLILNKLLWRPLIRRASERFRYEV